jgi:hypothetical protein
VKFRSIEFIYFGPWKQQHFYDFLCKEFVTPGLRFARKIHWNLRKEKKINGGNWSRIALSFSVVIFGYLSDGIQHKRSIKMTRILSSLIINRLIEPLFVLITTISHFSDPLLWNDEKKWVPKHLPII